ncbi:hypothetical protein PGH12_01535 [Chryseobacterium wangxinyae]|uniref:hypothetical protein n=1 Tax=Chryseobacterium sp. CY350 TaxID=2997336 RepID=UPI00226DD5CD|nr:hypothetical protein [Chryseobacterium sp. CY350]MCY0977137.1 hypothetical protein [Chryseobacterium sp. CY350]WBZ95843.1 hypothetical protein PGH12_01535 [Chryseobacterium sp. CY350]
MKKKLILRLCITLIAAFLINSCRTDQFPDQELSNNSSAFILTSEIISLKESKHENEVITELDKAKTHLKTLAQTKSKNTSYGSNFSIDTENIIYIENGPNYHTYTFRIIRDNTPANGLVENLLLTPLPDGSYKEFLVLYNLTEEEKLKIQNNEFVDTKGKTEVIELSTGNYSNISSKSQSCSFETVTINISCTSGHHMPGQSGCKLPPKNQAKSFTMVALVCSGTDDGGGGGGGGGTGPGTGGGGGGEPCTDCPPGEYTPEPCTTPQVPSGPLDPSIDLGIDGCGTGVPTQPNLPVRKSPCQKTKEIIENPAVQEKLDSLKDKSLIGGEMGFKTKKDGTTSDIIDGGAHEVDLGDRTGWQGGYHNHTVTGIPIHSPPDIDNGLLKFARSQPAGEHNDAYFGMIVKKVCSTCTGGFKMYHYVIRFNGSYSDATTSFSQNELDIHKKTYQTRAGLYNSSSSNEGLEKLLFKSIKDMGLEGKIILQRIEDNGAVTIITQNSDKTINAVPCP